MAITYDSIVSYTFPNNSATIYNITSIPQSYTDLRLVFSGNAAVNGTTLRLYVNNDQTGVYQRQYCIANSTQTYQAQSSSATRVDTWANVFPTTNSGRNLHIFDFPNYSSTTHIKCGTIWLNTRALNESNTGVVGWNNAKTNAITQINLDLTGGFAAGSTLSLYGITKA